MGKKDSKDQPPYIDPRHCCFRLSVRPSGIHRWGVFAEEAIPERKKVIEYTGEKISRKETKKRGSANLIYLFTLNAYWTVDGSVGGSGAEYVNHSCDPNLRSWIVKDHILYMSKRPIRLGEELTIDYRFDWNVDRVPCLCGTHKCRGTINLRRGET